MSQIGISLSSNMKQLIEGMAEQEGKSLSRMCGDLIERGLMFGSLNQVKQMTIKNMEYLIRILNITSVTYAQMRNGKTKFDESLLPEEVLSTIQKEVSDYIKSQF